MISEDIEAELEYLRFFHSVADFGPADDDVRWIINNSYINETGNPIPEGYGRED